MFLKFKQMMFLTLIIFFISPLGIAKDAKYNIRWKFNHYPLKYFQDTAEDFKAKVEKATGGNVSVEIIVDNSDREPNFYENNFDRVKNREYEMSQIYTSVLARKVNYNFHVFSLPFLFESDEHVTRVVDYEIGDKLLASLDKSGVKGLGFTYSGGFEVIASRNRSTWQTSVTKVSDFKGMKFCWVLVMSPPR